MTEKATRNRGAVLLVRTGKTSEEIAARCDVSRSLVSHWMTGFRKPTTAMRRKLEAEFEIPRKAWDQAPPPPSRVAAARVKKEANGHATAVPMTTGHIPTTKEFAELLLRDSWAEIQASISLPARERQAVREKAAAVVERVGKITGEHSNISERKIMRTPAWQRVRTAIDRVLEGHPDLERKLGEELAKLGREST